MDAADITLSIFHYTQQLALIAATSQKASDKNAWAVLLAHAKLKTRTKEIAALKAQAAKRSSVSNKTLSLLLEHAQQEAEVALNQLAHVEAEVHAFRLSREVL